jgi:3-hydroxy-9,10-secoandrosta-1,3,5(10)-triene-9,17-dione monooxygenase reductase component
MEPRLGIDQRLLRAVCGHFPTGVTVVTTGSVDAPIGITVNSFTSVSLNPPLVLFCLHELSGVRAALDSAGGFAVNILAADQEHVSRSFAGRDLPRFEQLETHPGNMGIPIISGALAYLECKLYAEHAGGDHRIIVGEVLDLAVLREAQPLVFLRGSHIGGSVPNGVSV